MPFAFRCIKCGHLVTAAHAGVRATPRACPVCKAGVTFAPDGSQTHDASVWERLADATPERLDELGLTADDVEAHEPDPEADRRANLERCEAELRTLADKKAAWEAKAPKDWQAQLEALHARLDALEAAGPPEDAADHEALAAYEHERLTLGQRIADLLGREYTAADEVRRKDLEETAARGGAVAQRPPRHFARGAKQRQGFTDRG